MNSNNSKTLIVNSKTLIVNFEDHYELLEKSGIILSNVFQKKLIDLGVFHHFGEYYLEDILKIILPFVHNSAFFKMLYDHQKKATVILDNGALPSEELRASSDTFVNAAGEFLIQAIERGFVTSNWKDFLEKGLQKSEYYVRSNLYDSTRNWVENTFRLIMKEKCFWYSLKQKLKIF